MATTKKRINITLSEELDDLIEILARGEDVPKATKAREMLEKAAELYEDEILVEMAEERDTPDAEYIPAEEVWKQLKDE